MGRRKIVVDIDADREALIADGDPTFPVRTPDDEWLAIALNNTSGTIDAIMSGEHAEYSHYA